MNMNIPADINLPKKPNEKNRSMDINMYNFILNDTFCREICRA